MVSVRGGDNVGVAMVRDLAHVVEREKAALGLFITLAEPTGPMRTEAVKTGFWEADAFPGMPRWRISRVQIMTVRELLAGTRPNISLVDLTSAFRRAPVADDSRARQDRLL